MQLINFLEHLAQPNFLIKHSHICLAFTQEYPSLVATLLMAKMKKASQVHFEALDIEVMTSADLMGMLQMSFLGTTHRYWLRNVHMLTGKDGQRTLAYLTTYVGPHSILYALPADQIKTTKSVLVVEIPEAVNKAQFIKLLEYEQPGVAKNNAIVHETFHRMTTLSIDNAYMLMQYLKVVGVQQQEFVDHWLGSLIVPEKSLFTLSTYFFAQDAQAFFKHWAQIKDDYADTFWVTFWSEQVWRAAQVVRYMQHNQVLEAKKNAYRLPFSFMQRDWRKFTYVYLQQAHHALYAIDYRLKNGFQPGVLDVFFTTFFIKGDLCTLLQ
jgi:hypothetical protein